MPNRIRKAVFPVAGLGTRFLPATKAMPKEMLTVVDRPVIQHVVDEARAGGIEHFIFVTGRNKGVIEDHFDSQFELERTLAERGKTAELEALMRELPKPGQTSFTRQQAPAGPRACGVVRARDRRQRAVRAAAARRAALRREALHRRDDRGLCGEAPATTSPWRRCRPTRRTSTASSASRTRRRRARASPRWWRSRSPARRRPTCTSPAATSWSRRFSTSWARASAAPAARSRSPTP